MKKKPYNPLFPEEEYAVSPVVASKPTSEETAEQNVLQVKCGPKGQDIPAILDATTMTVMPVLR